MSAKYKNAKEVYNLNYISIYVQNAQKHEILEYKFEKKKILIKSHDVPYLSFGFQTIKNSFLGKC